MQLKYRDKKNELSFVLNNQTVNVSLTNESGTFTKENVPSQWFDRILAAIELKSDYNIDLTDGGDGLLIAISKNGGTFCFKKGGDFYELTVPIIDLFATVKRIWGYTMLSLYKGTEETPEIKVKPTSPEVSHVTPEKPTLELIPREFFVKSIVQLEGGYKVTTTDPNGQTTIVYAKDEDVVNMPQWNDVVEAVNKNAPDLTTIKCMTYTTNGAIGIKEITG